MGWVLIWLICGIISAIIGSRKGEGGTAFIIGLLLGPFGIVFAIFSKGNRKACHFCKELIHKDAIVCPNCQREVVDEIVPRPDTHNICPACRKFVLKSASKCKHCGAELQPEQPEPAYKMSGGSKVAIILVSIFLFAGYKFFGGAKQNQVEEHDLTASVGEGWETRGGQGKIKFVLVDKAKERSEAVYQDAIRKLCEPEGYCYLFFWSDESFVPVRLPMSDADADAQVASYSQNPTTDLKELLWSCRINNDPKKCFS